MIHAFLLIGQSNMSGRGDPADVEPIDDDRLKVLRNGRWHKMFTPVHWERRTCGVCLAESFAQAYANDHPGVEVGLIPCADGGTSLNKWRVGGLLYDNAVMTAKLAQRTANIAGILWHQGESDCGDKSYPLYYDKLEKIMAGFRRDLDLEDVPLLVGGLGDWLHLHPPKEPGMPNRFDNYVFINDALRRYAAEHPLTGYVDAAGLGCKPDTMHFNAAALREFGVCYYEAFRKLEDRGRVYPEKPTMDEVDSALELL